MKFSFKKCIACFSAALIAVAPTSTFAAANYSIINPLEYKIEFGADGPAAIGKDYYPYGSIWSFKDKVLIGVPDKDDSGNYKTGFTGWMRLSHNSRPGIVKGKIMYEFSVMMENLRVEETGTDNFGSLEVGRIDIPFTGYDANGTRNKMTGVRLMHEKNDETQYNIVMWKNSAAPGSIIEDQVLAKVNFGEWYTVRIEVNMYEKAANFSIRQADGTEYLAVSSNVPISDSFVAASPYCGDIQYQNTDMRMHLKDVTYFVEQVDVKDVVITEDEEQVTAKVLVANDTATTETIDSPTLVLVLYDSLGRVVDIGMNSLTGANALVKREAPTTLPADTDYRELTVSLDKPRLYADAKAFVIKSMNDLKLYMDPVSVTE